MGGVLSGSAVPQTEGEQSEAGLPESCSRRLTFVSHAGEDKEFVRVLLEAMVAANVATFFDDDMAVGTPAGHEMTTRAATADLGVVVLSRSFLTKEWPMMELHLFVKHEVRMQPLYYGVNPDQLQQMLEIYDRRAGNDEPAFRRKMKGSPSEWRELMDEIGDSSRDEGSTSLPDPMWWREDVGELSKLTGLRREDFGEEEAGYVTAVVKMVSPPVIPAIVPPLPDHFVHVHMVDDVISELLGAASSTERRGVVLTGIGGAGKSLLASAVVRDKRIRRHFADGVLWLDQEPGEYNEKLFLLKLNELAQQFERVVLSRRYRQGRDSQYNLGEFTSVGSAQGHFQMWQKKFDLQCLLVVDNTWNVEVLQAVDAMGFRILMTTRKEAAMFASPGWSSKVVPPMDEGSSLYVLQKCSGASSAVPRALALEVAKTCAFLPLALAITGSTLRGVGNPLSPETWRELNGKLKDKKGMIHEGGNEGSLNNILAFSIDELGQTRRVLFLMLAVLRKGVLASAEMLRNLWGEEDLEGARFFIDGLVTRSLLQRRDAESYFVHDLLLDFAKVNIESKSGKFEAIKEIATSRQKQYLGSFDVLRAYSGDRDSLQGLYSLIRLWQSLEELSGDERLEVGAYEASLKELGEEDESTHVAEICSDLADMYKLQGKYEEADPLFKRSLAVAEKDYGFDHPEVATIVNNWAGSLEKQGKYEQAETLYERAIIIWKAALGNEHPRVAAILNNRAGLLRSQGKYDEADPLFVRVIEIIEKALGPDHPHLAASFNNRAGLLQAQGKYAEADPLYERSQAIEEKVLGSEHPILATTLNNRAALLDSQGKYDEAGPLYERSLAIMENILGPDHPDVAQSVNNRAVLLDRQGNHGEAEILYRRSLAIRERTLGPDHPAVATTLNNLAGLLRARYAYAEAGALYERSQAIREKVLGPEHPDVAQSLNNRASLLESQRQYAEAELLLKRSQAIQEKVLGPEHPDVASSLNNRAELLRAQGKLSDAEPLYKKTQEIFEKSLGQDHPNVAAILNNRALLLKAQGKYDEADPLYLRVLEILGSTVGEEHPNYASTLHNRAGLLYIQGKYEQADPLYLQAIKIWEEALGPDHPEVAYGLNDRTMLLESQGNYTEAILLLERALSILTRKLEADHHHTANMKKSLEHTRKKNEDRMSGAV